MKSYKLSFGNISVIKKDLAEVVVDDGIEMDVPMVEEFHEFLTQNFKAPFRILVNRKNSYSYTFQAQKIIGNIEQVKAIAVIIGTNGGLMSTETLINLNKESNWNINLFQNRDKALEWLNGE